MLKKLLLSTLVLCSLLACEEPLDHFKMRSPDGTLVLNLEMLNNKLYYNVDNNTGAVVTSSLLELFPDAPIEVLGAELNEIDNVWHPVWGQQSSIHDQCKELVLDIKSNGVSGQFFARIYNEGLAFRFTLNEGDKPQEAMFTCEYALPAKSRYYFTKGETDPLGPLYFSALDAAAKKKNKRASNISLPLVVESDVQPYMALLESDLFASSGIGSMKMTTSNEDNKMVSSNAVRLSDKAWTSPWRVILLGDAAGDLVVNTVPQNLATPNQLENTEWIKPGKTLWDWRVHGYTAPDGFTYGIDNESYYRFIDFADATGIEYFLIDDAWYKHVTKGHFELSDKLDLDKVIAYAADKDVELMLYYDRRHGEYGDDELFPYYQSLGMKGIKYGFMGNKVDFSREAIQKSAESELLIDFHDGPVPFTGMSRTYPNAITREYCHAQQDSRRAFTPETFIKMALINAITGPLDMNNGNFDLTGINSGLRQKGPRKTHSYLSTVASEAARTLVIFSGLVCIPDAPEAYAAKADLFEFIQKMPVGKWDESRILHSKIGAYITTARRHGDEWFVGSVYDQNGGTLNIDFDFLKEGQVYDVTYYEDTEKTHCKTNPEAYQVRQGKLKKGDIVEAAMAPGGGHCMWIRPE